MELSPVKARLEGKPILLDVKNNLGDRDKDRDVSRFSTGYAFSSQLTFFDSTELILRGVNESEEDLSYRTSSPRTFSSSASRSLQDSTS